MSLIRNGFEVFGRTKSSMDHNISAFGKRAWQCPSTTVHLSVPSKKTLRRYATLAGENDDSLITTSNVKTYVYPRRGKQRLVILGSGWGAMSLLKSLDQDRYSISLVSPNTYFAMTPLLAQAAVGTMELRATMEPIRANHKVQFYHAWVESLDLEKRRLTLMPAYPPAFRTDTPFDHEGKNVQPPSEQRYANTSGGHDTPLTKAPHRRAIEAHRDEGAEPSSAHETDHGNGPWHSMERGREYELPFDKLVIAVGAYNRTFSTPGVREHAWFLKDVHNARAIRWRILECMEQADHPNLTDDERRKLLSFVIVGGGPTGSELAAELHDLLETDLKRLFPRIAPLAKISIVDASSGILNSFDASLATYAREKFRRDGIQLLLNRKVKAVESGRIICEPDGEINFGLLVWSTGICASPLVENTNSIAKDAKNSFFLTDNRLRVLRAPSDTRETPQSTAAPLRPIPGVYAIGDCAQMQDKILPATAQVASQKGKHLAHVLNGQMSDDPDEGEKVFKHRNMGAMASLGGGSAIVDSPTAKAHGRVAWIIWRSAYTYMSLSWRNRLLVPFFWTVNRLFGRDLTRF